MCALAHTTSFLCFIAYFDSQNGLKVKIDRVFFTFILINFLVRTIQYTDFFFAHENMK